MENPSLGCRRTGSAPVTRARTKTFQRGVNRCERIRAGLLQPGCFGGLRWALQGKTSKTVGFRQENRSPGHLRTPRALAALASRLAWPRRARSAGRSCKPRSLPRADRRGCRRGAAPGSPGGLWGRGVLGWLRCERACARLTLVRLQPFSQEPPASTQRVQTDDCHWLRFEARGILLTEKSDTPGGRGEKGAVAQTRGREKRGGKRLYSALFISIKSGEAPRLSRQKPLAFLLQRRGCEAMFPPPFWTPGLAPSALCEPAARPAVQCSAHPEGLAVARR